MNDLDRVDPDSSGTRRVQAPFLPARAQHLIRRNFSDAQTFGNGHVMHRMFHFPVDIQELAQKLLLAVSKFLFHFFPKITN
jgi:hypothetical protein